MLTTAFVEFTTALIVVLLCGVMTSARPSGRQDGTIVALRENVDDGDTRRDNLNDKFSDNVHRDVISFGPSNVPSVTADTQAKIDTHQIRKILIKILSRLSRDRAVIKMEDETGDNVRVRRGLGGGLFGDSYLCSQCNDDECRRLYCESADSDDGST